MSEFQLNGLEKSVLNAQDVIEIFEVGKLIGTAFVLHRMETRGYELTYNTTRVKLQDLHLMGLLHKTGTCPARYHFDSTQIKGLKECGKIIRHKAPRDVAKVKVRPRAFVWGEHLISGKGGETIVMKAVQ